MSDPTDDLAGVLSPMPATPPDPARRASTLAATTGVLLWGRTLRRAMVTTGVVAAFVAGGVCGWLAKPTLAPVEVTAASVPVTTHPSNPSPVEVEPLTPEQLELRAELSDEPSEAARLFREAGDRFLTVNRDYENAAR